MRVLLVPELYRPDDATANGSLNDLVTLVEEWLARDSTLHVYWLLPPRDRANYDATYVHADRDRVTLLEAEPLLAGHERESAFVETGHAESEFRAVERAIYDQLGYIDVVVDQRVTGRYDLYKWVCELSGHERAAVDPADLVGYVHDLRLPFKRHGREYPGEAPTQRELLGAAVADGLWFKAGVDAERMADHGSSVLDDDLLADRLDDAIQTGSPIEFDNFEEHYAAEPTTLHVAGSGWGKKNLDDVLAVGRTLYDRYGIRTVMTNMDPIPGAFADREFVDAHPEADRETYERALRAGDLTVCASDHETMARTWFEQAASGQVLVARDRPWIHDCVPDDHRLLGNLDELTELACWAVEHWDEAVTANQRLVEHVRDVRSPARCGERTHIDLSERVRDRADRFSLDDVADPVRSAVESLDEPVALDALIERTAEHTDDGRQLDPDSDVALIDLVFTLRAAGYADVGNSGTPRFMAAKRIESNDHDARVLSQ